MFNIKINMKQQLLYGIGRHNINTPTQIVLGGSPYQCNNYYRPNKEGSSVGRLVGLGGANVNDTLGNKLLL